MSGVAGPKNGLTRRSFLKTTAAVAGAATIAGGAGLTAIATNGSDESNDQYFYSQCRGNCQSGCPLDLKVRNGKLVHSQPGKFANPAYNRLCVKGYGHPQRTYSPKRLQYPMRLIGERGSGEWERITWDEAISEICEKWKKHQAESGDTSIVFMPGSGASCTGKNIATYNVLKSYMGASATQDSNDVAGIAACERIIGMGGAFYGNSALQHSFSKTIMIMGSNPCIAHPNTFHFLQDARQNNGCQLIHVDPNYSITSANCDKFVPIRPGTDTAMLLAMTNYVIENGWENRPYLLTATVAPYLVKESDGLFLRGSDLGIAPEEGPVDQRTGKPKMIDPIMVWDESTTDYAPAESVVAPALEGSFEIDGIKVKTAYSLLVEAVKPWTLEKASELCDVSVDTIKYLVDRFVNHGPAEIYMVYGVSFYNKGYRPYHAALTFLAVTGNFGKPGAGIAGLEGGGGMASPSNPVIYVKDGKPAGPSCSAVLFPRVMDESRMGNVPVKPRSAFLYGNNPIAQTVDRRRAIETLRKLDFVVVVDMWMTDTIDKCADMVLPVCGWMETEDLLSGNATPHCRFAQKAIDPLYESKNDFEINRLLLDGMGFKDKFNITQEEYLAGHVNTPQYEAVGFSFEKLKEQSSYYAGEAIHGKDGVFPTATGKLQFYVEKWSRSAIWEGVDFGDQFDDSDLHLPHFAVPHEAWPESVGGYEKNPLAEKYPLIYTSIRNRFTTHSMWADVDWYKEVEPVPTLRINPFDAEDRGIEDGDTVRAFNDRGEVVLKAIVNPGIRPGMVVYPKGWQYYDFIKGHTSDLISGYVNPEMYAKYYFDVLCEVEKYEGGAE